MDVLAESNLLDSGYYESDAEEGEGDWEDENGQVGLRVNRAWEE